MTKYVRQKDHLIPDQVNASIVDYINTQRINDELIQRSAQDAAFYKATEQVEKVRDFVSEPNHILGSDLTKHGEIAEQVEVGIRNAKSCLHQQEMQATFDGVGRTAPEDYVINGLDVQSKFFNGVNKNYLSTLLYSKYKQGKNPFRGQLSSKY